MRPSHSWRLSGTWSGRPSPNTVWRPARAASSLCLSLGWVTWPMRTEYWVDWPMRGEYDIPRPRWGPRGWPWPGWAGHSRPPSAAASSERSPGQTASWSHCPGPQRSAAIRWSFLRECNHCKLFMRLRQAVSFMKYLTVAMHLSA